MSAACAAERNADININIVFPHGSKNRFLNGNYPLRKRKLLRRDVKIVQHHAFGFGRTAAVLKLAQQARRAYTRQRAPREVRIGVCLSHCAEDSDFNAAFCETLFNN